MGVCGDIVVAMIVAALAPTAFMSTRVAFESTGKGFASGWINGALPSAPISEVSLVFGGVVWASLGFVFAVTAIEPRKVAVYATPVLAGTTACSIDAVEGSPDKIVAVLAVTCCCCHAERGQHARHGLE